MSVENSFRIVLSILGVYAVLFAPPWLPIVPMILLAMRFRAWEIMILGLLTDFIWTPTLHVPLFLLASVVIVWAFEPLRKELLLS